MLSNTASHPPQYCCRGSPSCVQDISVINGTEMTPPLTLIDGYSAPETAITLHNSMAPFQLSRECIEEKNRPEVSAGGTSGTAAGEWRSSPGNKDINRSGHPDLFHPVLSIFGGEHSVPVSSIAPGSVYPRDDQLTVAYGYAIRREDGTLTRLIRADELTHCNIGIPSSQGPEGLIILPAPKLACPERRDGPEKYVTREVSS
jgi:hypothetical protein